MFTSYKAQLASLIKKNKRILIYHGQNDFKVNSAGALSYLYDIQWEQGK